MDNDSDSAYAALAFGGTFAAGFALTIALFNGDTLASLGSLGMTLYCAYELIRKLDFAAPS